MMYFSKFEHRKILLRPDLLTSLLSLGLHEQLGDWEKALKLYEGIRSSGVRPTVSTFNALMTALCKLFTPWLSSRGFYVVRFFRSLFFSNLIVSAQL